MANRATLTVSLTPQLGDFVASRVSTGKYVSASEVIREGLRLLQERELYRDAEMERLRREIAIGLDQARAGELLDGEKVFDELEQQSSSD